MASIVNLRFPTNPLHVSVLPHTLMNGAEFETVRHTDPCVKQGKIQTWTTHLKSLRYAAISLALKEGDIAKLTFNQSYLLMPSFAHLNYLFIMHVGRTRHSSKTIYTLAVN